MGEHIFRECMVKNKVRHISIADGFGENKWSAWIERDTLGFTDVAIYLDDDRCLIFSSPREMLHFKERFDDCIKELNKLKK